MIVAAMIASPVILFGFYLAYVTLRVARDNGKLAQTPLVVRAVCWAILITGFVLDMLFNVTIGTVMFRELPEIRRLTFTARCSKHLKSEGFRGDMARFVCDGWLNPFQAGHCG